MVALHFWFLLLLCFVDVVVFFFAKYTLYDWRLSGEGIYAIIHLCVFTL